MGTRQEDYQDPVKVEAYLAEQDGQPWAILNYKEWSSDMTPNLARSLIVTMIAFGLFGYGYSRRSKQAHQRRHRRSLASLPSRTTPTASSSGSAPDIWAHLQL